MFRAGPQLHQDAEEHRTGDPEPRGQGESCECVCACACGRVWVCGRVHVYRCLCGGRGQGWWPCAAQGETSIRSGRVLCSQSAASALS